MNDLTSPTPNELAPIDQNALRRLREKAALDAAIQVWKPAPGDVLEGAIVGSREVVGPFGPQHQALIQTPTGAVIATWLTPWLLDQLRAQCAEVGDLVALRFIGKETSRTGASFNRMSVTTVKP